MSKALDVAESVSYERQNLLLRLASRFALVHDWPMVERAVKLVGPSVTFIDDHLTQAIRDVEQKGSVDDALHLAAIISPDGETRGRMLLSIAESYAVPIIGIEHANMASVKRMTTDGLALLAKVNGEKGLDVSRAKACIAAGLDREALEYLATAARDVIKAKDWESLGELIEQSVRAHATDHDLNWFEAIKDTAANNTAQTRLAQERKYGPDGQPIKLWLESSGGSPFGGPYEQWFAKSLSEGDIKTAIEASKGIDNDGRRAALMLSGVGDLLKASKATEAIMLTEAIPLMASPGVTLTFDEDRYVAIAKVAPVFAKAGLIERAVGLAQQITAPHLKARALGAMAAAISQKSAARSRALLDESLQVVGTVPDSSARDREVATIIDAYLALSEVDAAKTLLAKLTSNDQRDKSTAAIVDVLTKQHKLRAARLMAENIADFRRRQAAYLDILE